MRLLGAPITIDKAEAHSLDAIKKVPSAPQVPFGIKSKNWEKLKAALKPGDELYEYDAGFHGGLVLMRNRCIVAFQTEWMS